MSLYSFPPYDISINSKFDGGFYKIKSTGILTEVLEDHLHKRVIFTIWNQETDTTCRYFFYNDYPEDIFVYWTDTEREIRKKAFWEKETRIKNKKYLQNYDIYSKDKHARTRPEAHK
jgi:hypothetical protein